MAKRARGGKTPGTSNNLRRIRTEEGFSRPKLANAAEVSEQTVTRIEKGQRSQATTRHKVLSGLNQLAAPNKYSYKEVFPRDSEVDGEGD